MQTFFCENIPAAGAVAILSAHESHHALRVFRVREGDCIRLLDGSGKAAIGKVMPCESGRGRELKCRIQECIQHCRPAVQLRLLIAPPRSKLMGQVVRIATELGILRITPILCRYSVAKPDHGTQWQADAVAAIKQSGNVFLPRLDAAIDFAAAIAESGQGGYFGAVPQSESIATAHSGVTAGTINVWIGPEGGFAEEEISALIDNGCTPLTVGHWILRVETAVPALMGYLLGNIKDDLLRCKRC